MRISDWSAYVCSSDLPRFADVVENGAANARATRDFTVEIEARGLRSGETYSYRFFGLGGTHSPVGVFETPSEAEENLRFVRSDGRRVGKECGSTCRSGWWPYN